MTDNEIIKALECCSVVPAGGCDKAKCPMIVECLIDRKALEKSALDLINRQKAEISELQHKNSELEAELDDLKRDDLPRCKDALRRANEMGIALDAEVEHLKKVITITAECANEARQRAMEWARAEAIKEFAERLKEMAADYERGGEVNVFEIDNLVKEMVGDDNENL